MWKMCQEVDVEAPEGEGEGQSCDRVGFGDTCQREGSYRCWRCRWRRSSCETSEEEIEGWYSWNPQTTKFSLALSSPSTYIWYPNKKTTIHSKEIWWLRTFCWWIIIFCIPSSDISIVIPTNCLPWSLCQRHSNPILDHWIKATKF